MSNKRILVVDDELNIRILLGSILQQAGYVVDTAEDGFVALKKIQHIVPDLVVTDLRMPNMNGFELLSTIRTRFPNLPAIAISGEFVSVHESPLADAFFQKSHYTVPDFLSTVSDLLSGSRKDKRKTQVNPIWAPTGDAALMLTCAKCLHSFPIDPNDDSYQSKETDCIFCGARLEIHLIAIGVAQPSSN